MHTHLYILTGASRGLGLGLAEQLLSANHRLLCISRHASPVLALLATHKNCLMTQWELDLSDALPVANQLAQWFAGLEKNTLQSATLINNAAVIPTIAPLSSSDPLELALALRVGLEAPMLLTAAFLKATESLNIPRKVLNISSGLGRRPMAAQSAYCAAKAGMDHFTRCLALDEVKKQNGAQVCSLAPGVVDTDMQLQLRSATSKNFPDQANFVHLKQSGQLASPTEAARKVLAWLARTDFGQQPIADVRVPNSPLT